MGYFLLKMPRRVFCKAFQRRGRESHGGEKKKGIGPFSITLFHNLIFIDTGEECDAGFFEVNLSDQVDAVMYKSRLYTKMHL